jgi:transcription elongation factor Elf1
LLKKLQEYIAAHPAELRMVRDPSRDLTGKPLQPEVRILSPTQWVAERTADAEELLSRKTCKQCHLYVASTRSAGVRIPNSGGAESGTMSQLLDIAPAKITTRWLPHAKFDHHAHRSFTCTSCHAKALSSTETSEVLGPGIENCKTCHAPGPEHAESRCFECHTYHDWSKRKEVKPAYTLPALRIGGR